LRKILLRSLLVFGIILIMIMASLPTCSRFLANRKINHLFSDYLSWFQLHYPVEATQHGLINSNALLPDFSADSVAAEIVQLNGFLKRLKKINPDLIGKDQRISYHILRRQIELKIFELDRWRVWKVDANFYTQKIQDAIYPLSVLLTDSTSQYASLLIKRLETLPRLMAQLKKNVKTMVLINQELAVRRALDLQQWIGFDLRAQLSPYFAKSDTTARLTDIVDDSLMELVKFLDAEPSVDTVLTPFSEENYSEYLKIVLDDTIVVSDLLKNLQIQLREIKGSMYQLAREYFVLQKKTNIETDTLRLIRLFDNEIKNQMLRRDQIETYVQKFDGYTRRFITDIANLDIDTNYSLQFQWEILEGKNPFQLVWQETIFTEPLQPMFIARLTSVNKSNDLIEQLSILRRYNKPAFKIAYLTDLLPLHYFVWSKMKEEIPMSARILHLF